MKYINKILIITLVLFSIISCSTSYLQHKTTAKINDKTIKLKLAKTNKQHKQGLMFIKNLPENHGMLFIFDNPQILNFYMKNTYIPLSIAFLDEQKQIVEIYQMKPLDETNIKSSKLAKYALEMNLNWFKKNNIKIGDKLIIY